MTDKTLKYKINASLGIFVIGVLLFGGTGCRKNTSVENATKEFAIDNDYQRGPLTVHVRVDKSSLTIAETFFLELEAGVEAGYDVKMPEIDKVLENFGIVDWDNLGKKLDENNNVLNTYRYKLEPFLSGTFALPAFTFEFYDANNPQDKKYELTTEPIDIEVVSLLGEQRAELKIADIEGVVGMPDEPAYWWIWALSVTGIIAAVIVLLRRKRRRTRELIRIFKPAHEIAYSRLRVLVAKDLVKAGKVREFYEQISDILRHYIEHRFNLKAPDMTTEEFLAKLSTTNILTESDQQRLEEFLTHCDLVKFAKHDPTAEQIQKTFDLVRDFIETTKSDEKKVDVTEIESNHIIEAVRA